MRSRQCSQIMTLFEFTYKSRVESEPILRRDNPRYFISTHYYFLFIILLRQIEISELQSEKLYSLYLLNVQSEAFSMSLNGNYLV